MNIEHNTLVKFLPSPVNQNQPIECVDTLGREDLYIQMPETGNVNSDHRCAKTAHEKLCSKVTV